MVLIDVQDVGLRFALKRRQREGFKGLVARALRRGGPGEPFWALDGVSLTIAQGECVGIIGRNGSGKTTLARVLSGIYPPDRGAVAIHGRVTVLALGAGFMRDLSGRQNIHIQCALMGLGRPQTEVLLPQIIEFGDLGGFIDQPVRMYSSGMQARLAFSVAVHVTPDILIVDEALSVGDEAFRARATEKMHEMMGRARGVVVITHSLDFVRQHCTRAVWLRDGRVAMDGEPEPVVTAYTAYCRELQAAGRQTPPPAPAAPTPQPTGSGR